MIHTFSWFWNHLYKSTNWWKPGHSRICVQNLSNLIANSFVCVLLSLCPPPCSISLRVLLLYESSQEDSSSGPPTSRVQLWKEAAGWVTFTWAITTFWDRYRGERATFWRYRKTHHTNDTVVLLSPNMLNSNQARTKCYDQCQDCSSSLIRREIIVCLFLMNT